MVQVNDIALKTTFLATLIERLDTGDIEPLIRLGIPAEDLDSLRGLSATDLTRLASNRLLTISYHIQPLAISQALTAIRLQSNYETELEAFINAGASLSMLRQLFRTDIEQVKAYREMLAPRKQPGRPTMPNTAKRDAIHAAWSTLRMQHGLPTVLKSNAITRKSLLSLHQQFSDLSLETIFAVLHEFDITKGAS
jgi:hypothetical protein